MVIERLELSDFRNYEKGKFELGNGVNVFFGENGSGKTNLLEAVYLVAVGESFKARKIEEMVRFGKELGRVIVKLDSGEELEVMVTNGKVLDKRTAKRLFKIDGASKRRGDFVGCLKVVLFRPEDMEFMGGTPAFRRSMIDKVLMQVDGEYARSLMSYNQALRRRNKLLESIRENKVSRYGLAFWDGVLIKHGQIIQEGRLRLVEFLNRLWKKSELFLDLFIEYDKSVVSKDRLAEYEKQEVWAGHTLVGPHKDDYFVGNDKGNLGVYGSRGEQRMGVLALKMGEVYFLEQKSGEKVVLLLDDVLSELDERHRLEVMRLTDDRQVFLTTANEVEVKRFGRAKVFRL